MQRIMFVISGMGAGGAERVMSLLTNSFAEQELKVKLVLVTSGDIAYNLNERIEIHSLCENMPKERIKAAWARFSRLRKCIKEFKPDIVVSFLTKCNIYSCLAGMGLGIPVVVSERNDPIRDCPSKIQRTVRNMSYRLASGVVFQTESAKACFPVSIRKKSAVISNPVKRGLPIAETKDRQKTIVAAGRLNAQKNYPMMLKAFSLFHSTHPDYALHIYGEGNQEKMLRALVSDLSIEGFVEFKGVAPDLHERITNAGMFVLSSDYEGISNSLLEALSMGLPCISTDCPCGGSRQLIEDGVNGLLVPVGDAESFANAMARIADDDEFATRMGGNACATRDIYSSDEILKQYYDFISRITQEKNRKENRDFTK